MATKILVVEDELKILEIVKLYLEREGYNVFTARTGLQALKVFSEITPDLVILDLMLPELAGEEVLAEIRENYRTPVIILTAKTSEDERIAGLRHGADDYVIKPFSPKELVARVAAVLRRSGLGSENELRSKDHSIFVNLAKHLVLVQGHEVALTPTEYRLLVTFLSNPDMAFSRSELAEKAFGWDYEGYEDTIYVHIKNLRKKIETYTQEKYISTVYGIGYKWVG